MLTDAQEKLAKAAFQKTTLALDSAPNTWVAFRAAWETLLPVIDAAHELIAWHADEHNGTCPAFTDPEDGCECKRDARDRTYMDKRWEAGL